MVSFKRHQNNAGKLTPTNNCLFLNSLHFLFEVQKNEQAFYTYSKLDLLLILSFHQTYRHLLGMRNTCKWVDLVLEMVDVSFKVTQYTSNKICLNWVINTLHCIFVFYLLVLAVPEWNVICSFYNCVGISFISARLLITWWCEALKRISSAMTALTEHWKGTAQQFDTWMTGYCCGNIFSCTVCYIYMTCGSVWH